MANLILLIDDDPDQHLVLDKYLKLSGFEVIHAETGEEGLQKVEESKPDLVLLDIQMPGMDGFRILELIRKKASNRNISVLFLTAIDRKHLKIKGLELGADDYITKPFDRAELLARINAVLRRSDRYMRLEGVMEGDLSDVGLSDLLQSMELGSKTATITLREAEGEIGVRDGEFVYAKKGSHEGNEAMLRLFLLEKGYFSIQFNKLPPNVGKQTRSLTSVLMNTLKEVDEIKEQISQFNLGNRRIVISGEGTEFPEIEKIKPKTPMSLVEMIIEMDKSPKENIRTLIAAGRKKLLKVEK